MAEAADPLVGTVVGARYRITRRLGRGGMGAVYAAEQSPLGREVALKLLRPELAADATAIERFRREAKVIASLGHPHVVAVHDFGTFDDGTLFIAMELLHGDDLSARLRRSGPMPWPRVLDVVEQVARALAGAHAKGIVHRDLKPANVLLMNADGATDFVKVVDFGIAKLAKEKTAALTGGGFIPGTAGYIAPENIKGGGGDDPRADLYSLGVTAFEMLTNKHAFPGDGAMSVLLQQLNDDPPRPSDVATTGAPKLVEDLVMRLMNRDPSLRPATAEALLVEIADLRRALSGFDSDPHIAIGPAPPGRAGRTTRFALVAAAFVVVSVVVVGVVVATLDNARAKDATASVDAAYYPAPPAALPELVSTAAIPVAPGPTATTAPSSTAKLPAPVPPPTPPPSTSTSTSPTTSATATTGTTTTATATTGATTGTTTTATATTGATTGTTTTVATTAATDVKPSADEVWRVEAVAVLTACTESCAKVIGAKLKDADLSKLTPSARGGVDECVSKCKRKAPAP